MQVNEGAQRYCITRYVVYGVSMRVCVCVCSARL